ncbi:InvB/SpaK family type III secretion system chaperone [Chitinimonas sp. PSY-7]|uniref:InvB/SpaK family type III secretion system chaperone n=1 Tax=Chitinimonas sp. PSY-7 TaxID=3459088 RepID=UPI0040401831
MSNAFYDPLSFSQASAKSLTDIVREALVDLGCPANKLNDFDQQASITVEVDGLPDIQVSIENDRLWVWSALADLSEECVMQRAVAVLSFLVIAVEDVETGQLVLGKGQEGYELKALVSPTCLKRDNGLANVIEQFQGRLEALCQILAGAGAQHAGSDTAADKRINWL